MQSYSDQGLAIVDPINSLPSELDRKAQEADAKRIHRENLAKLDNAKFGWFHIKACIVSGIGFFTVINQRALLSLWYQKILPCFDF